MSEQKIVTHKSPFPGMDPYLEGELWPEFHQTLAHELRAQLMKVLPPEYVALLEKYYAVDYGGLSIAGSSKKGIYPDVHVSNLKEVAAPYEIFTQPASELTSPIPQKVPLVRVAIRDTAERRLVTVIEILSPVNKQGKGFQEYVDKRTALLQTETHLLEIDLLRAGERIPLIGGELPPAPYYIFLSRFTRRPITEVWPVQLREPLPTLPVPLLPPDADVPLPLQVALNACFDLVRYHERLLDYSQPPPPPALSDEDLEWVKTVTKIAPQKSEATSR